MPLKNPFKRSGNIEAQSASIPNDRGFSDATVAGANPTDEQEPVEYQLSEIDDSGVFLPPSDLTSKPGFWHTKSNSSFTSSNHRSVFIETEPFSISRESFDSYRRSFDITARSPFSDYESRTPRRSLESSLYLSPRPSVSLKERRSADWPDEVEEESVDSTFEDVKLADEAKQPARKRGFFSRLSDNNREAHVTPPQSPSTNGAAMGIKAGSHGGFQLFSSRKRGQSGQGSELLSMPRPMGSGPGTPPAVTVGGE